MAATQLTELIISEEHGPLIDLWRERGDRAIAVCHVDFHCDMRGLLIDRRQDRARYVWQSDPYMNRVDSGSFLAHAVMDGIVTRLRWIHDDFGGRKYDNLYCVKYETDLTALPFLLTRRTRWVSLVFAEETFADWAGPLSGEYLSIDWDGLAFADYSPEHIRRLMSKFFAYEFHSKSVYVSRSSEYCYADRALFDEFISTLEKKLGTKAVYLPTKKYAPLSLTGLWAIYHQVENRILRMMRKIGIY